MNRREMIAILGALPVALKAAIAAPLGYGLIDVNRYAALCQKGIWLRVMFNGVDVTDRCREADDKTGRVVLYRLNGSRNFYIDGRGDVVLERLYGQVRFIQVAPLA